MVQRRAGVRADDHWRPRHGHARVSRARSPLGAPADDRARADLCERVGGLHHLRGGAERSDISRRPDCARSRSRDGRGPRPALGAAPRRRPQHDRQPARREEGLLRERAPRDGRAVARAATSTIAKYRRRAATTRRSAAARSLPFGPAPARSIRSVRRKSSCRSSSATSSAARPTCAAGAATRSSPLSGAGLPIGGNSFVNFSTELRFPIVGKIRRGALPRRRQRLDQSLGLQPQRPALRRRGRVSATTRRSVPFGSTSAGRSTRSRGCS